MPASIMSRSSRLACLLLVMSLDVCNGWCGTSLSLFSAGVSRSLSGERSVVTHRTCAPILATRMGTTLPRNIKDSINQLRQSMQSALSSRLSRVDVEFPYAANLGIEGAKKQSEDAIPMTTVEVAFPLWCCAFL